MFFLMMLIDSEEERSKFEVIYETYHRLMFFLARQILPDDRDAEDAVQEAFITSAHKGMQHKNLRNERRHLLKV